MEYIILLSIYLISLTLSILFKQPVLIGISGIAFFYPVMNETNIIIITFSIAIMLFHFVIGFIPKQNNDY